MNDDLFAAEDETMLLYIRRATRYIMRTEKLPRITARRKAALLWGEDKREDGE